MYPDVAPDWELYERHLEEAEFLWGQWELSLVTPGSRQADVARREARLLAHVDALALGGAPVARRFLSPSLSHEELARVAVAALALLQQEGEVGRDAVLTALAEGPPEALPGLQRALTLCDREELLPLLAALARKADTPPERTAVVLEVHASHGRLPDLPLTEWLSHPAPALAAAACRVVTSTGTPPTEAVVRMLNQALHASEPSVRDAALEGGAVLGLRAAWERCRQLVQAPESPGRLPLMLVAMGGDVKEQALLGRLLEVPGLRADTVWALGHGGRFEAAELCLGVLEDANLQVARLATEAFAAITGFPLEGSHVREEEAPPEDDAPDAELVPPVEAQLPRASPEAARAWWARERQQGRFGPGGRYLAGAPFSAAALVRAFGTEPARRWPALALELSIRSRGRHRVSPQAFSGRRLPQLASVPGFAPRGEKPFPSLFDQ